MNNEWKIKNDSIESEFGDRVKKLQEDYDVQRKYTEDLKEVVEKKSKENNELQKVIEDLTNKVEAMKNDVARFENSKAELLEQINNLNTELENEIKAKEVLKVKNTEIFNVQKEKESGKVIKCVFWPFLLYLFNTIFFQRCQICKNNYKSN